MVTFPISVLRLRVVKYGDVTPDDITGNFTMLLYFPFILHKFKHILVSPLSALYSLCRCPLSAAHCQTFATQFNSVYHTFLRMQQELFLDQTLQEKSAMTFTVLVNDLPAMPAVDGHLSYS